MFQSIFRSAQGAVEKLIDRAVSSTVMAVPFIIATGFGTAAMAAQLNQHLGPVNGNLVMGAIFAMIGLLTIGIVSMRTGHPSAIGPELGPADDVAEQETAALDLAGPAASADRELVAAAISALGPTAAPYLLQAVLRNLPLVAVIVAALLVAAQSGAAGDSRETDEACA